MSEVTLESLVGEHNLQGVDFTTESTEYSGDAQVCVFKLSGKVYTCTEDPDDGYRSHMKSLALGGKVKNVFRAQKVLCSMSTNPDNHTLIMRDVKTGKDVLVIGTENTDDYYPYFVANFQPQNMACNANK